MTHHLLPSLLMVLLVGQVSAFVTPSLLLATQANCRSRRCSTQAVEMGLVSDVHGIVSTSCDKSKATIDGDRQRHCQEHDLARILCDRWRGGHRVWVPRDEAKEAGQQWVKRWQPDQIELLLRRRGDELVGRMA